MAAQQGDRAAMDALLRRHHDRIWAVCRRLAGNDADAADATQEALVLIVRRLHTFDGRSRFTTWAHRVATNACLDELRRRKRRPDPGLPDDDPQGGRVIVDRAEPVDHGVTERLTVDAALSQLPEEFRVAVVLRDLGGHDYAEISAILDIPAGTVRSRISRGRRMLAEILGTEPGILGAEPGILDTEPGSLGGDPGTGNHAPPTERPSNRP